jgi:hypothetical protein
MRQLQRISWAMTLIGIAIVLISVVADLQSHWLLTGLLLAWAGIVKIAVTLIWTRVARMGTDDHQPIAGP